MREMVTTFRVIYTIGVQGPDNQSGPCAVFRAGGRFAYKVPTAKLNLVRLPRKIVGKSWMEGDFCHYLGDKRKGRERWGCEKGAFYITLGDSKQTGVRKKDR